jgi:hypothetical protein
VAGPPTRCPDKKIRIANCGVHDLPTTIMLKCFGNLPFFTSWECESGRLVTVTWHHKYHLIVTLALSLVNLQVNTSFRLLFGPLRDQQYYPRACLIKFTNFKLFVIKCRLLGDCTNRLCFSWHTFHVAFSTIRRIKSVYLEPQLIAQKWTSASLSVLICWHIGVSKVDSWSPLR